MTALAMMLIVGCAGPAAVTRADPLGSPPADFSIEIAVRVDPDLPPDELPPEAHLRPSTIILLPDGSLHYGPPAGPHEDGLPPLQRVLRRDQVAAVWALARQIGFADPANGLPPVDFDLVDLQDADVTYLIAVRGYDQRWMFVQRSDDLAAPSEAGAAFVRQLARLAWATDLPQDQMRYAPLRYDFGPDPYARYRQ